MLAAYVRQFDRDDPLAGLEVGEVPDAAPPAEHPDWVVVDVRAAALNQHDLWSLRGVGLRESQLPMVLGCDSAGTTPEGREVLVHAVVGSLPLKGVPADVEERSILSERYPGTLAEKVAVPAENLLDKPDWLSWEEAACLPTAWLTAYRMLFDKAELQPGATVLVQGAGGGVATALIALGAAAGYRVWATSRSEAKRKRALELGAEAVFEPGARLPERVDAVMETVGQATWSHSLKSLRPGGRIVVSGATTGQLPPAELNRVFFLQLSVVGSTMGTRDQLVRLSRFLVTSGLRPPIDRTLPLARAREGFAVMAEGDLFGKIVFTP